MVDVKYQQPDEKIAEHKRRMAACWKACEGIPTDRLETDIINRLIKAIRLRVWNIECDRCVEDDCQAFGRECDCRCHSEQEKAQDALMLVLRELATTSKDC